MSSWIANPFPHLSARSAVHSISLLLHEHAIHKCTARDWAASCAQSAIDGCMASLNAHALACIAPVPVLLPEALLSLACTSGCTDSVTAALHDLCMLCSSHCAEVSACAASALHGACALLTASESTRMCDVAPASLSRPGQALKLAQQHSPDAVVFASACAGSVGIAEALSLMHQQAHCTPAFWMCAGVLASGASLSHEHHEVLAHACFTVKHSCECASVCAAAAVLRRGHKLSLEALESLGVLTFCSGAQEQQCQHVCKPTSITKLPGGELDVTLDLNHLSTFLLGRFTNDKHVDGTSQQSKRSYKDPRMQTQVPCVCNGISSGIECHLPFADECRGESLTDALTALALSAQDVWNTCGKKNETLTLHLPTRHIQELDTSAKLQTCSDQKGAGRSSPAQAAAEAAAFTIRARDAKTESLPVTVRASMAVQAMRMADLKCERRSECACATLNPQVLLTLVQAGEVQTNVKVELLTCMCTALEHCQRLDHITQALDAGLIEQANELNCSKETAESLQFCRSRIERQRADTLKRAAALHPDGSAKDCRRTIEAAEACADDSPFAARTALKKAQAQMQRIVLQNRPRDGSNSYETTNKQLISEHERSALETAARAAMQSRHAGGLAEAECAALTAAWSLRAVHLEHAAASNAGMKQEEQDAVADAESVDELRAEHELSIDLPSTRPFLFSQSVEQPNVHAACESEQRAISPSTRTPDTQESTSFASDDGIYEFDSADEIDM